MNGIEEKEITDLLQHVNDNFDLDLVKNVENLKLSLKVYLGLRKIIESYELDGINPRCHYDFSKRLRCTCCVAISMLSDEKIVTGCEGDIIT